MIKIVVKDYFKLAHEIERLQNEEGHTHNCACNLAWGDAECECKEDPNARIAD